MNLKEIKEMIALMNEHNLTELELEKEGLRIRLKKNHGGVSQEIQMIQHPMEAAAAEPGKQEEEPKAKGVQIKAPMVGTFYRSPSPDAEPYVHADQIIEAGHVICIIEAMKLMNEIKSEMKARILDILVENGQPVEFGQPLFSVEPIES